ncbi:MAG: SURF1 family cytochrome oxidase biogenesis protein [Pseudomonadota bacterium]
MIGAPPKRGRSLWVNLTLLALAAALFVTLIGLGNWQMRRLDWKRDLIEAVETRAYGVPVPPPSGAVSAEAHAYLRVALRGTFRHEHTQRVKAVTELGPGYWVLVPLDTGDRSVWINRGFVPQGLSAVAMTAPLAEADVTGLLRITEPDGTLLEKNDPGAARWVTRDVAALSAAAELSKVAPFFVDADHSGAAKAWPRGGLTQVAFRNSHLSYALTWYGMAGLFLFGMGAVLRDLSRTGSTHDADAGATRA